MGKKVILQVKDLHKSYGNNKIVKGLSFEIKEGEIVGLLGPNGAGKTTAFYMTIGLIKADQGSVIFKGVDITNLPIHERAVMGIGYLAQEPSIFRSLTVEENILAILENQPMTKQERSEKLAVLLEELHLTHLAKVIATNLSGGERRRLEITRALVTNPSFLLLDEPFANIDPIAIHDVKSIIKHLAKKKISILITDHNAREIFSAVDRSYIMKDGKAKFSGNVEELVNNPEVLKHYLGNDFKM
jgi:lipopolysaccharide export system ATP-binding protein